MGSTTFFRKGRMIGHRNKNGRDQSCCQNRYHQCCEHVTGWPPLSNPPQTSTTTKPTTVPPVTPRSVCPKSPPSNLSKFQDLYIFNKLYLYNHCQV